MANVSTRFANHVMVLLEVNMTICPARWCKSQKRFNFLL